MSTGKGGKRYFIQAAPWMFHSGLKILSSCKSRSLKLLFVPEHIRKEKEGKKTGHVITFKCYMVKYLSWLILWNVKWAVLRWILVYCFQLG